MNSVVRMPQQMMSPSGQWWNGSQWCNNGCDDNIPPFPCPPPGFPPPGCPPWFSGMNSPPWYPGANAGVSFGTTAPANPVRGHFWWDGKTLWMFDGAAWVSTGGEGAQGTTPPSSTAPANPVPGQQWFNGTTLYVWDGNAWVPVSQTKTSIQATAPPAPNPGDLWWNGTQMYIWSGSAWMVVGPGAAVGPTPTTTQTFALAQSSAMTVPTAWSILPYTGTPLVDTQSAWDPVQHKITPKVAGVYWFGARGAGGAGTGQGLALLKNDTGTFTNALSSDIILGITSATSGGWMNVSGFVPMNGSSDFVRVWGWANGGIQGSGSNPVVAGYLFP